VFRPRLPGAKKISDTNLRSFSTRCFVGFVPNKNTTIVGLAKPPTVSVGTMMDATLMHNSHRNLDGSHISSEVVLSSYPLIRHCKISLPN